MIHKGGGGVEDRLNVALPVDGSESLRDELGSRGRVLQKRDGGMQQVQFEGRAGRLRLRRDRGQEPS
jgi:hypothetical protein